VPVLTPAQPIAPTDVRHGLLVERGGRRDVLLLEVATEQG
jgi:hypothetical protein